MSEKEMQLELLGEVLVLGDMVLEVYKNDPNKQKELKDLEWAVKFGYADYERILAEE